MKTMKRVLSLLLAALLCVGCAAAAMAVPEAGAKLYSFYGDNMLFAEKQPAVLAGTASGGIHVTAELLDAGGNTVAKGAGSVNKSGRFALQIPAPSGSYEEYTIVLSIEGVEFARLQGVVFGALWMSGGQSNMQMPLGAAESGFAMADEGKTGSRWLRFLTVPSYVEYNGDAERFPLDPQRDIPGCIWTRGDESGVFGVSAVSYHFAEELQKTLHMPVGVLCTALGGSSIYSWLSREAIESDPAVKADLIALERYFPADTWQESGHNVYSDMTVNYNKKIEALRVFRPAGLIWYQGETDLLNYIGTDRYARAFDLMQSSWSRLFGYSENEQLPIVYTQLASYSYGDDLLSRMHLTFSAMQRKLPQRRAMITIYDVPLTYRHETGTIHPTVKSPIGQRMAYAAEGMVYDLRKAYTAPTVQSSAVNGSKITVTLRDVGTGLTADGEKLRGFSVCGPDGVYVQADARITAPDTLEISAPEVPNPVSAAYAFSEMNGLANVFASDENGKTFPVSPFMTDPEMLSLSWQDRDWADCDTEKLWHYTNEKASGFYDAWTAANAALSYVPGEDGNCLRVQAGRKAFTVQPTDRFQDGMLRKRFPNRRSDFSRYERICFRVRNVGTSEVSLRHVRLYTSDVTWYAPIISETNACGTTIPADGAWHSVTLDLTQLYRFANACGITYTRAKLHDLSRLQLRFKGASDAAVELDSFRFTPNGSDVPKYRFVPHFERAHDPFAFLCSACMGLLAFLSR